MVSDGAGALDHDDIARWARSGAMALTGDADGPPLAPAAPVASRLDAAADLFARLSERLGRRVDVDGPALLADRAARRGLSRNGQVSAGGSCRLLPANDGWVAVSLARDADWELVPAWLRRDVDDWAGVATAVAAERATALMARASELGLPVGALPPPTRAQPPAGRPWQRPPAVEWRRHTRRPLRAVDLSALWAGPLCAQLLGRAGVDVRTVEDPDRPDGARLGDADLHEHLHAGHDHEWVRLATSDGRRRVLDLVAAADIVVTSARRRALRHLGIDPADMAARRPGLTWVAITAYGLDSDRVGFGDDVAVDGGLVAGDPPRFCADAAADPATGLFAAVAAARTVLRGGGVVDVAMRDVAADLAAPPYARGPRTATRRGAGWAVLTPDGQVPVATPRAPALSPA